MANSDSDDESDFLYEDAECLIGEEQGIVFLRLFHAWSPAVAKLAKRFKVRGLSVCIPPKGNPSLDFLAEVPKLRVIEVSSHPGLAWSRLESLSDLEEIQLWCDRGKQPQPIDFTRFKKLTTCRLAWSDSWASILQAKSLRKLQVSDADDLVELDCSKLNKLQQLTLLGCFKLKSLILSESAKLRSLRINGCPRLIADWKRIGRDLERLSVQCDIGSPIDELRHAKRLKTLYLDPDKLITSLSFLRELPNLREVGLGVDAKLSKAARAIVDEINEGADRDRAANRRRVKKKR